MTKVFDKPKEGIERGTDFKDGSKANTFKDPTKNFRNNLTSKSKNDFMVCEICFGTKFSALESGVRKCKKCGQLYWM